MNKIIIFFIQQGMVIGELIHENDSRIFIKNPSLIIIRSDGARISPLLDMVEEKEITIRKEELFFKRYFTPKTEILNYYNQIFGSGLVIPQ